ncbi:MAG: glycoside hydrolase family 97 protein [Paludibacteraceae bacterium]
MKPFRLSFFRVGILVVCCLFPSVRGYAKPLNSIVSPDGSLRLTFSLTSKGEPQYTLSRRDTAVLLPSSLGMTIAIDQASNGQMVNLSDGMRLLAADTASCDTVWETVWGEEQFIRDRHTRLTVRLQHRTGIKMNISFRLFNDGMAFRYSFPEQKKLSRFLVLDEHSAYTFAFEPQAWSIPWRTEYYEALWRKAPVSQKQDTLCSPLTLEFADGSYGFLHEAALTDYPAQNFYCVGQTVHTYLTPLRPSPSLPAWEGDKAPSAIVGYSSPSLCREGRGGYSSPWRMFIFTRTLPELVASRIMLNLNEPCRIEDTSWIKPMKYIGIWWGMHIGTMTWNQSPIHGATTANMTRYMHFAAEHGFGGVLAEGWNEGWETWVNPVPKHFEYDIPYPDFDIDSITRLSYQLGVEMIGHHETGGRADEYEPRLDKAFAYAQAHNIHVVKTGYVSPVIHTLDGLQWNKSQAGVRHYRRVIETAAKYHVAINNHEPVMPTGLQRTYPNLLTQEGVRGQEWNAWAGDGGSPCEHATVLPFTRILCGPVDYTPGVFNFDNPNNPNTRAHATITNQLALFVCFYSPLQMACDLPEHYLQHPDAFSFIERVPCDWKQTLLLDGRIGDYCVFARQDRHSDNWFVGGITDENPRELTIDFSFLEPGITYTATIYRDAADADWKTNPYAYRIDTVHCRQGDSLTIPMASGGGFAIILDKR